MIAEFAVFVGSRLRSLYIGQNDISRVGGAEEAAQDGVVIDAGRASEIHLQNRSFVGWVGGIEVDSQRQVEGVRYKPDRAGGLDGITEILRYLYGV